MLRRQGSLQQVASGSVTQSNMKISAVNGTAFIDFTASAGYLPNALGANPLTVLQGHRIHIRDSAGKEIIGYIGAAGTGETYLDIMSGSTMNGNMETGNPPTGWLNTNATLAGAADERTGGGGAQSLSVTTTVAWGLAYQSYAFVAKALYYKSAWLKSSPGNQAIVSGSGGSGLISYSTTWEFKEQYSTNLTGDKIYCQGAVTGVEYRFDDLIFKKVLTPSSTGCLIVSTKGGAVQNFASKNSAFNYDDASGYTYAIFKDHAAVVVASGTYAAGGGHLSMVDGGATASGGAFADIQGLDLSPYAAGRHLLAVYDSSGRACLGYIKSVGGGESLSPTELLSNPSFDANTTGWTPSNGTIASIAGGQVNNGLEITRTSGNYQFAITYPSAPAVGKLVKFSAYVKSGTSGDDGFRIYLTKPGVADYAPVKQGTSSSSWTAIPALYIVSNDASNFGAVVGKWTATAGTMLFDEASVKQVLTPSSTGAVIVNSKGGATYNWLYKNAAFDPNTSGTYKVYYLGDT
jgi:hypothetical protein